MNEIDELRNQQIDNVKNFSTQFVQPVQKRIGAVAPTYTGPKLKRRWPHFVRVGRSLVIFFRNSTWRIGWWVVALALLSGCSLPCTYHGKAVPRADAERMRGLGMDVVCPQD